MSILERVRSSCAQVMQRARFVRIDEVRLQEFAAELATQKIVLPTYDLEHHFRGTRAETAAFVLALDAVNFGSGYFPELKKPPGLSGYFTIATALKCKFETSGAWSARELQQISLEDCACIFDQDLHNPVLRELMDCFRKSWNELGAFVLESCQGHFEALLESAEHSAERLVEILATQSCYQDQAQYGDLEVAFYKRAQITVMDLVLAFDGEGLGQFFDLDRLTIFADNLVPHVLRIERVLCYDDSLLRRINAGELIPQGSSEEIEIRAAGVTAVERLVAAINALPDASQLVNAVLLDQLLWQCGQRPEIKRYPRHRTRSIFY